MRLRLGPRGSPAFAPVIAFALVVASCGVSDVNIAESAESTIESELPDELALRAMTATCNRPARTEVGSTFRCEAVTEDGSTIAIVGEITGERTVAVEATNVVASAQLGALRQAIADRWEVQAGWPVGGDDVDCGSAAVVLDAEGRLPCTITDPATSQDTDVLVSVDVPLSLVNDIEPTGTDEPAE